MGKAKWGVLACAATLAGMGMALSAAAQTAPPGPPPGGPEGPRRFAPPPPALMWAPKKTPLTPYRAPNRPWWKLADVRALHKGQANWTQPVISGADIIADWHQLAPGRTTQELAYSDNRTGIIVWEGEVRVRMAGQEPFVARKGFEIDVPHRVPFTLEALPGAPALYLEIHATSDMPLYPVATNPTAPKPVQGYAYAQRLLTGGPGGFDAMNKPYLDYYKDVVEGGARAGPFISAQHMFVNNIRGRGVATPPASNLGHFHVGYDEFWFVMEGNVTLQVEGVPVFTASPGDVIMAAQGRWHRASFGGPEGQMGTRVAVNPYPAGLHGFTVESGGRQ